MPIQLERQVWSGHKVTDSGAYFSATDLYRVFLALSYIPVCLIVYRNLFPRLHTSARRLATILLIAQLAAISVSLVLRPQSHFEKWLWDLDQERNIPATLAAAQLTIIGAVSLLTTLLARGRPMLHRIYFAAMAVLFIFLARDEFYAFHEGLPEVFQQHYFVVGLATVTVTLILAFGPARNAALWHILVILGLAVAGFGGIVLEYLRNDCVSMLIRVDGCVRAYYFEEILEFLGMWLVLVAMLGHLSTTLESHRAIRRLLFLLLPLSILLLLLPFFFTYFEIRYTARESAVRFESDVRITAFHFARNASGVDFEPFMTSTSWHNFTDLGNSVHLVDQVTGKSVASADMAVTRRRPWSTKLYRPNTSYRQRIHVDYNQALRNRAYWIVWTQWREIDGEFVRQQVRSSDLPLLDSTQIILGEFALHDVRRSDSTPVIAKYENGFMLEGLEFPELARAGENLSITFTWRSNEESLEEIIQFLHFVQEEKGEWWGYDQRPLGDRLPTRFWYDGLADSETWEVAVPADLEPGHYTIFTGLYRLRDQARMPARNVDGELWTDARVWLGAIHIDR